MAGKAVFELHHNFPKLADESGFTFNIHHPRGHVDWNKIRLIDIDGLVRERKFGLIEQHVTDIMNCVLESEFDVRILNEGVLKMFRLAQLAVEYQQFCRHYLDRSVYVLKEEISSLVQELEISKKDLREKDEEIRKLKRKTKHSYRTMPYGNDNIAAMILKTLSNKNDLFPSTSNGDGHQYNKCSYCDKAFLNQLYLKSHMSRRHANVTEIPQRDVPENSQGNNANAENKLSEEISELKNKLKEMESLISENKGIKQNLQNKTDGNIVHDTVKKTKDANVATNGELINDNNIQKHMKDAEVSTNNDDYLLEKIEAWKKEEHEKYNKEINLLRTQILDTINGLKDKETKFSNQNESNVIDLLHKTICEQGSEITALKQELNNSKKKAENENTYLRKEAEEQLNIWTKRLETQSKQQDLLLQKLNDLAKEARESRKQAEKEKDRAEYLQDMLHENINKKPSQDISSDDNAITHNHKHLKHQKDVKVQTGSVKKQLIPNPQATTSNKSLSDRKTLEILHQKAQELLNLEHISSSSSDISSEDHDAEITLAKTQTNNNVKTKLSEKIQLNKKQDKIIREKGHELKKSKNHFQKHNKSISHNHKSPKDGEEKRMGRKSSIQDIETNGPIIVPRSPMKLVRAKITEEVNNRLLSGGMDPLKIRLPENVFRKQRLVLQQQQELKSKKNPTRETVKHTIIAYLDSAVTNKDLTSQDEYVSPNKESKILSLKSMLSNVKTKALSLVKSTDVHLKTKPKIFKSEAVKRDAINGEVAKRAMALLKTPPGSAHSSPVVQKYSANNPNVQESDTVRHISLDKYNTESNIVKGKVKKRLATMKTITNDDTSSESARSDDKYYKTNGRTTKSIDNLIKSPARRPASAEINYNRSVKKYNLDNGDIGLIRSQSAINVSSVVDILSNKNDKVKMNTNVDHDADDIESIKEETVKQGTSDDNIQNSIKQTKGVLKNASSTSSLNKKKVLFDMDAIQMKSVSASPSQSITEKSDGNEKYELGLINLEGEEWDISSIENEPLKNDTKIQVNTRTSPKIAELKQTIESQLARRTETPSTVRAGAVDIAGPMVRVASSIGGSNTSLGSSILDESDAIPPPNQRAFVKSKIIPEKEDSEIDISEFSIDGIGNKNESF